MLYQETRIIRKRHIEKVLDDEFIRTIRVHKREISSIETDELFEYDTRAAAHTTNQYHRLTNNRAKNVPSMDMID
jgi:hypothetical protein